MVRTEPPTPRRASPNSLPRLLAPFGKPLRRPVIGAVAMLALMLFSLAAPAMAAQPSAGPAGQGLAATVQPKVAGDPCNGTGDGADTPCGTWAWGAAANLTAGLEYEGAYNASQFLTGGAFTAQGAYIDLEASLSVEWAAYAIVNATTPSPGQLAVTFQAGDLIDLDLSAVAQGDFPQAGTYGPDSNVTFQEINVSLVAHEKLVDRYQAFLNFTSNSNGSLALESEHLQVFRTLTVSLTAVNFPNITADPSGDSVVSYTTGQVSGQAEVAVDVSATFTPALLLVQGPLYVGESWTTDSQADFNGQLVYSVQLSGIAPGGTPFNYSQSGQESLTATFPVVLAFTVTGERTLFFPNGSSETDYVISCQSGANSASGVEVYDGIMAIPTEAASSTGGVSSAVAEHPASSDLSSAATTPTDGLYSKQRHMADASDATPVSGQTVTASPMSPAKAQSLLNNLGGLSPASLLANSETGFYVVLVASVVVVSVVVVREIRRRARNRAW